MSEADKLRLAECVAAEVLLTAETDLAGEAAQGIAAAAITLGGEVSGLSAREAELAAEAMLAPLDVGDPLWGIGVRRPDVFIAVLMFGNGGLRIREALGQREPWEMAPPPGPALQRATEDRSR